MRNVVLVVDDDEDFLELLTAVLGPNGYKIVPCPDPAEAHTLARQWRPAVILLDLVMPYYTGWQVIEQVEADPGTHDIPIVVCTAALSSLTHRYRELRLMGCEVLLKPFELEDLLSMLARVTAQRNVG